MQLKDFLFCSTHCVIEGAYYWEATVLHRDNDAHVRIGFARACSHLQVHCNVLFSGEILTLRDHSATIILATRCARAKALNSTRRKDVLMHGLDSMLAIQSVASSRSRHRRRTCPTAARATRSLLTRTITFSNSATTSSRSIRWGEERS